MDDADPVGGGRSGFEDRLLTALRLADLACQAAKESALRDSGLSPALYGVLLILDEMPRTTSAEVARRSGVTPQTTSSLVGRLVSLDLVRREQHPSYRNVVQCSLTETGRRVLADADARVRAVERALVGTVGETESRRLKATLGHLARTAADLDRAHRQAGSAGSGAP